MPHPTENPNGGVEEPKVPTPRPEGKNEPTDPNRYDWRGDEALETIQGEIRRHSPEPEEVDSEEDSEDED